MILLSILTPAVPSRIRQLETLCAELERQIGGLPVEHLTLLDNKRRTVGEKRDALLRAAKGKYVAFVDDDDWVSGDYVQSLLTSAATSPDVITFLQEATVNRTKALIEFKLGNPNEPFPANHPNAIYELGTVKRNAWHVCAWRRSLALQSGFPATNYGEDWAYAAPLCAAAKLETHIPKVLHFYRHSAETTEAPPPGELAHEMGVV
jgi:hypothetical protein